MKKFLLCVSVFLGILTYTTQSLALIEIRAGYGLNTASAKKLNETNSNSNLPPVSNLTGLNIDLAIGIPTVPIGFGLRYETLSATAKSTFAGQNVKYETGFSRLAMLLNYRLLDTLAYLGPIATIGLTNEAYYKGSTNSTSSHFKSKNGSSYSIGFEGGIKFGTFLVGGELGYLSGNFGVPKDGVHELETAGFEKAALDFSGSYFKVMAGVTF